MASRPARRKPRRELPLRPERSRSRALGEELVGRGALGVVSWLPRDPYASLARPRPRGGHQTDLAPGSILWFPSSATGVPAPPASGVLAPRERCGQTIGGQRSARPEPVGRLSATPRPSGCHRLARGRHRRVRGEAWARERRCRTTCRGQTIPVSANRRRRIGPAGPPEGAQERRAPGWRRRVPTGLRRDRASTRRERTPRRTR